MNISASPKLDSYCKYKTDFEYEAYLDKISNDKLRICLTQLRLSSHCLEIEVGRYTNVQRENRLCKLCNQNSIESEYHFVLCCSRYRDIRLKYIGRYSWPNVNKFIHLMTTNNRIRLVNLARYIKEAMLIRNNTLEN